MAMLNQDGPVISVAPTLTLTVTVTVTLTLTHSPRQEEVVVLKAELAALEKKASLAGARVSSRVRVRVGDSIGIRGKYIFRGIGSVSMGVAP